MKTAIGLVLVLALVGCGDDPSNGTPEVDAGAGGALAGDAGRGGSGGAAMGTGGATADAGTGGAVTPGTGGAGSGGAVGSGGAQGSGGAPGTGGVSGSGGNAGTGGTVADTACVDPMGWQIDPMNQCMKQTAAGFVGTKKAGHYCATNCQSVRPGGGVGNYVGPPRAPECTTGDSICVASCGECS